jgi:uncharacterized GH25 family protein
MFRPKLLLAAASAWLALSSPALAHRQWMLPSATNLSGADGWVTVDAAVSNDLFYFEHMPMRLDTVKAFAPTGEEAKLENPSTGHFRSTFDVHLTQPGTWKIAAAGGGLGGSYTLNGKEERLPRGTRLETLATAIPAGATDVKLSEMTMRNEIFVTLGSPTDTVLKPTGKGLEMQPITHPTDLVSGEPAKFRFLIDGKPAAAITVAIIPGGIRYRDALGEQTLTTSAAGEIEIKWPGPGMYWLNATAEDKATSDPKIATRRLGYVSTLEVLAP